MIRQFPACPFCEGKVVIEFAPDHYLCLNIKCAKIWDKKFTEILREKTKERKRKNGLEQSS